MSQLLPRGKAYFVLRDADRLDHTDGPHDMECRGSAARPHRTQTWGWGDHNVGSLGGSSSWGQRLERHGCARSKSLPVRATAARFQGGRGTLLEPPPSFDANPFPLVGRQRRWPSLGDVVAAAPVSTQTRITRSVLGSRNRSAVGCQSGAGASASPWPRPHRGRSALARRSAGQRRQVGHHGGGRPRASRAIATAATRRSSSSIASRPSAAWRLSFSYSSSRSASLKHAP